MARVVLLIACLTVVMYGCDTSDYTPTATTPVQTNTVTGKLAQGYVKGATVFADKLVGTTGKGNFTFDTGEVKATSGSDGVFSFDIPKDYPAYVIVSIGGKVQDKDANGNLVERDAAPMLAPSKAASADGKVSYTVTPLTTLVALDPKMKDVIGAANVEKDIASPDGVDASLLKLAKAVESVMTMLASNVPSLANSTGATPSAAGVSLMLSSLTTLANKISSATAGQSLDDNLKSSVSESMTTIMKNPDVNKGLSENQKQSIAINTAETAGKVVDALPDTGPVIESKIVAAVNNTVSTAVTDTKADVKADTAPATLAVEKIQFFADANEIAALTTGAAKEIKVANADTINKISVSFIQKDAKAADTKTGKLYVNLVDALSQRTAYLTVSNVSINTVTSGTDFVAEVNLVPGTSILTVTETIANGTVSVEKPVTLNGEITHTGKILTFDLNALRNKLDDNSKLKTVNTAGKFTVDVGVLDVPNMVIFTSTLTVN